MSLIPGLLPRLTPSTFFRPSAIRSIHTRPSAVSRLRPQPKFQAISIPRSLSKFRSSNSLYTISLGLSFLGLTAFSTRDSTVHCDSPFGSTARPVPTGAGRADAIPDPNAPQSILNVSELGFGAVAGICAGVFLKKGLRALAFLLGGAFVFLQYMSSRSLVNVDWAKLSSKYDETFGTRTASGGRRAPTITGAYNWIVDFLTANFQQRASFIAGFVLGIRLG